VNRLNAFIEQIEESSNKIKIFKKKKRQKKKKVWHPPTPYGNSLIYFFLKNF